MNIRRCKTQQRSSVATPYHIEEVYSILQVNRQPSRGLGIRDNNQCQFDTVMEIILKSIKKNGRPS